MIIRHLAVVLMAGAGLLTVLGTTASAAGLTRKEIRSMPILDRPSRVGHFYGNAVRRNSSRGVQHVAPQTNLVPQNNPGLEN
jgi:hypothetical protein